MRSGWTMLAVFALLCGCVVARAGEDEQKVDLSQVPENVKSVATQALPDIQLTKAELEKKKDGEVYELEGTVGDKNYEIKVKPDGTLVSIKLEGKEGDEHGHKKGKKKKDHKKKDDDDGKKGKEHDDDDD